MREVNCCFIQSNPSSGSRTTEVTNVPCPALRLTSSRRGWTSVVDLVQKLLGDARKRGSLVTVDGARVNLAVRKW